MPNMASDKSPEPPLSEEQSPNQLSYGSDETQFEHSENDRNISSNTLSVDKADNVIFTNQQAQSYNIHNQSSSSRGSYTTTSNNNNKQILLAKFKESIKSKNSQIQILKESLINVNKFKEYCDQIKRELDDLKKTHDKWTVSIAESKRVMHNELERKNIENIKLKNEINQYQAKNHDCNVIIRQLRTNIQDLESKLVSLSAGHQKERETLTRDLTIARNNAIRQVQKEHEIHVEKVKLELERSVEALKMALLTKDQQLMDNALVQQQLAQQNGELKIKLEELNNFITIQSKQLSDLKEKDDQKVYQENNEQTKVEIVEEPKEMKDSETITDEEPKEMKDSETITDEEPKEMKDSETITDNELNVNNPHTSTRDVEFEYLRNVGQEPVILARVIGTILKFDTSQTDQVCAVQEAIHSITRH